MVLKNVFHLFKLNHGVSGNVHLNCGVALKEFPICCGKRLGKYIPVTHRSYVFFNLTCYNQLILSYTIHGTGFFSIHEWSLRIQTPPGSNRIEGSNLILRVGYVGFEV